MFLSSANLLWLLALTFVEGGTTYTVPTENSGVSSNYEVLAFEVSPYDYREKNLHLNYEIQNEDGTVALTASLDFTIHCNTVDSKRVYTWDFSYSVPEITNIVFYAQAYNSLFYNQGWAISDLNYMISTSGSVTGQHIGSFNSSYSTSSDEFVIYFSTYDEALYNTLTGDDSYGSGYDNGYKDGKAEGERIGYGEGYQKGKEDYENSDSQINSIFEGILSIGLIPLEFFMSIFNFEIFGINVTHIVSAVLTICLMILLMRLSLGGK